MNRWLITAAVTLASGCAHHLGRAHQGLQAPPPAAFSAQSAVAAEQARSCQGYDTCYLVCSTATPFLTALGAASAGLPALAKELPESTRAGLLITGAIAGALGTGTAVCSQACSARFTDFCTAPRSP